MFNYVQSLLASRRATQTKPRKRSDPSLLGYSHLSGKLFCGQCNRPMSTSISHRGPIRYIYYRCRSDSGGTPRCTGVNVGEYRLEQFVASVLADVDDPGSELSSKKSCMLYGLTMVTSTIGTPKHRTAFRKLISDNLLVSEPKIFLKAKSLIGRIPIRILRIASVISGGNASVYQAFSWRPSRGSNPIVKNRFQITSAEDTVRSPMIAPKRVQRVYDHRLRQFICTTGDTAHALRIGVPRSTANGWLEPRVQPVISLSQFGLHVEALETEVARLRVQVAKLRQLLRLLFLVLKISGFSFRNCRIPSSTDKSKLISRIHHAAKVIPLGSVLKVIGLSSSRFHAWNSIKSCELYDKSSCPRSFPSQMTRAEVDTMKSITSSTDYRHLSSGALASVARRAGKVFASPSTWYRFVRRHHWHRPRVRVYPPKPKVGIRASKPNEIWHVDTSLLRLLDGSRVYMHAIIDNFSRRILAWAVQESFNTGVTALLLREAAKGLTDTKPNAVMDSGIENINASVNELVESGIINRILAQVDVTYSNSMIESWWRALKHQWLYLHSLDTIETVRKLVAFYVTEHSTQVPHYAFKGQTPDEMYFSTGADVPELLRNATLEAKKVRREANLDVSCNRCRAEPTLVAIQPPANTTWFEWSVSQI